MPGRVLVADVIAVPCVHPSQQTVDALKESGRIDDWRIAVCRDDWARFEREVSARAIGGNHLPVHVEHKDDAPPKGRVVKAWLDGDVGFVRLEIDEDASPLLVQGLMMPSVRLSGSTNMSADCRKVKEFSLVAEPRRKGAHVVRTGLVDDQGTYPEFARGEPNYSLTPDDTSIQRSIPVACSAAITSAKDAYDKVFASMSSSSASASSSAPAASKQAEAAAPSPAPDAGATPDAGGGGASTASTAVQEGATPHFDAQMQRAPAQMQQLLDVGMDKADLDSIFSRIENAASEDEVAREQKALQKTYELHRELQQQKAEAAEFRKAAAERMEAERKSAREALLVLLDSAMEAYSDSEGAGLTKDQASSLMNNDLMDGIVDTVGRDQIMACSARAQQGRRAASVRQTEDRVNRSLSFLNAAPASSAPARSAPAHSAPAHAPAYASSSKAEAPAHAEVDRSRLEECGVFHRNRDIPDESTQSMVLDLLEIHRQRRKRQRNH